MANFSTPNSYSSTALNALPDLASEKKLSYHYSTRQDSPITRSQSFDLHESQERKKEAINFLFNTTTQTPSTGMQNATITSPSNQRKVVPISHCELHPRSSDKVIKLLGLQSLNSNPTPLLDELPLHSLVPTFKPTESTHRRTQSFGEFLSGLCACNKEQKTTNTNTDQITSPRVACLTPSHEHLILHIKAKDVYAG